MDARHHFLFDTVTGDLLPQYREAYLQRRLAPATAQAVEEYLKSSPIQKAVLLGRYHELAEEARRHRRSFTAPLWVQQQLIFQSSVSKLGPLRRPVVQAAVGLFLALSFASVVQWIRNEPFVPAPIAAVVVQAATRVSTTTQRFAQNGLVSLHLSKPAPSVTVRAVRPVVAAQMRRPAPVSLASARSVGVVLPDTVATQPVSGAPAGNTTIVQGRVSNQDGEPLVGATVLVVGSHTATSTNANGEYILEAPTGVLLQFAYAGWPEKLLQSRQNAPLDVVLEKPTTRHRVIP